jgi:hypothetical protein
VERTGRRRRGGRPDGTEEGGDEVERMRRRRDASPG